MINYSNTLFLLSVITIGLSFQKVNSQELTKRKIPNSCFLIGKVKSVSSNDFILVYDSDELISGEEYEFLSDTLWIQFDSEVSIENIDEKTKKNKILKGSKKVKIDSYRQKNYPSEQENKFAKVYAKVKKIPRKFDDLHVYFALGLGSNNTTINFYNNSFDYSFYTFNTKGGFILNFRRPKWLRFDINVFYKFAFSQPNNFVYNYKGFSFPVKEYGSSFAGVGLLPGFNLIHGLWIGIGANYYFKVFDSFEEDPVYQLPNQVNFYKVSSNKIGLLVGQIELNYIFPQREVSIFSGEIYANLQYPLANNQLLQFNDPKISWSVRSIWELGLKIHIDFQNRFKK